MKRLNLYCINDEYIDYLRMFDNRVFYNKKGKRPYVGIVLEYNNLHYFAPLASPKPKHKVMSSKALDIIKINNGALGIINLNNMIPTPLECIKPVLANVQDLSYKKLLQKQLDALNKNPEKIFKKVLNFYMLYQDGKLTKNIVNRTCDFKLLEEKCLAYNKTLVNN